MFKISLSKLNNDQLYTLAHRIDEVIKPHPIAEMGIEIFYQHFSNAFKKYAEAREKLSVNGKVVSELDRTRDVYYDNMESHLQNYLHHPDENIKKQAEALVREIDKHGNGITRRKYKEETAILQTIIAKVKAEYLELMETTHNVWFNLLVEAQENFEKKIHELSSERAEKSKINSPTALRPELETNTRKLLDFIPMQFELTQNNELGGVIELLKEEFRRF